MKSTAQNYMATRPRNGPTQLIIEILYKALWKRLVDTRTLPGEDDGVEGAEHVHKVVNIDQSPIGRNSASSGRQEQSAAERLIVSLREDRRKKPILQTSARQPPGALTVRGKTIDDVLNMSVAEGVTFFAGEPAIGKKIDWEVHGFPIGIAQPTDLVLV